VQKDAGFDVNLSKVKEPGELVSHIGPVVNESR